LWTRQLSLILGSTTHATGTVLAAFMGGLGVGAWVLGRRADRVANPLALYAGLEAAIGLLGLASPYVLAQGGGLYALCYARLHDHPAFLTLARFLIGFLLVAVPASLMGGTLPVVVRHVVRGSARVGRSVGLLYALNTLGAAVGTLLLPFALLPALGVRATLLACGTGNLAIAAAAWAAARRAPALAPAAGAPRPGNGPSPNLLRAFFLSGFVALALETVWNRFFSMYFGSSIYTYALILVIYLGGIFLGGLLFAVLDRRGRDPARVFAVCLGLLLVDLAATVPLMDRIVYVQLAALDRLGLSFWAFQLANVAAAVLVILPPTLLFGASFPAVAAAVSRGPGGLGADLGRVYLINTAGTTAGALAASFLLIPVAGVRGSLELLAVLTAAGLALAAQGRSWGGPRWHAAAAGVVALALLPALLPGWDARLMHAQISSRAQMVLAFWRSGVFDRANATINVREVRDGVDTTVSIAQFGAPTHSLLVNGKIDASDSDDVFTQVMLGHLPMIVHPAARDVLVIGMGSGVTLAAAARHPAAAIDLVEISPEVLDLGDRYFRAINRDVLHDARVAVHVEDGRNFVAFHPTRRYDVIISEPSNPWMTGVANLFTDEFFAQARERLRPGGILSQWFHYYSMDLEDVRSVVGTLQRHFPHVYGFAFARDAAWSGDLLILASEGPIDFGPAVAAFGGAGPAAADLAELGLDGADDLVRGLVLSRENVDRFVAGAPLNSDDRPRIELHAPRALFAEQQDDNLRALQAAAPDARLPVAPRRPAGHRAAFRTRSFRAVPPPGYGLVFSGYRLGQNASGPDGVDSREVLRELRYESGGGGRLEVLSTTGARDRAGLERLAALAAAAPVVAVGTRAVSGHIASVYRVAEGGGEALAWSCPASATSHAAVLRPAGERESLDGIRCRHR
jgi:spermidine synthase